MITDELERRPPGRPDHLREKLAFQDLARKMSEGPAELLPELVRLAMDLCDADSAGISILQGQEFRWFALTGALAAFEGTTTPRNDSPCGVCLDQRQAILMRHPEQVYAWIAEAKLTVPEVLLVPLTGRATAPLGTLWVIAGKRRSFDAGHAKVLGELASFTGAALHIVQSDEQLKTALQEQETLLREMRHRVSNIFAVTDALVQMTALSSESPQEMAASLGGRLRALSDAHSLVRASSGVSPGTSRADLKSLMETVLKPYRIGRIDGAYVPIGERATNGMALVLYELATNAAKYGALSTAIGTVDVTWRTNDKELELQWQERGGPSVHPPERQGFGTMLMEGTMASMGGRLTYDWHQHGVVVRLVAPLEQLGL